MNKEYDEIKDQEKKIWKDEELMFKGKLQVQVSHPDKPVSACCN